MAFFKEANTEWLQSLKDLIQRDRNAGVHVPPRFDCIIQSLDDMASGECSLPLSPLDSGSQTKYRPGRREFEVLQAYNALVDAGGRPVCRLEEIAEVSQVSNYYCKILHPWIGEAQESQTIDWRALFLRQLSNWQLFKSWQRARRSTSQSTTNCAIPSELPNPKCDTGHSMTSSISESRFRMHVESCRRRLLVLGFTKEFTFDIIAAKQDEWTTWVEYLSFECFAQDHNSRPDNNRCGSPHSDCSPSAQTRSQDTHNSCCSSEFASQSADTVASNYSSPLHGKTAMLEACDDFNRISDAAIVKHYSTTYHSCDEHGQSQMTNPKTEIDLPEHRHEQSIEFHGLILQWALSQEVAIAAEASKSTAAADASSRLTKARGTKRSRDGMACVGSDTCSHQCQGVESTQGFERDTGPKRVRSDG